MVVGSVRSVVQRVSPSPVTPIVAGRGEDRAFEHLVSRLVGAGYGRTDRVESRGEFAVRGGIIDVFPAQADEAVRIDFWGDTVEDVRAFSIGSQRSIEPLDAMVAFPAREFRPDADVRARAVRLVNDEPWAAATWDRIAEGVHFAGIESWMPWLADQRSLMDEIPDSGSAVVFDPARARDRARDLVKEEADLAEALADTWGDRSPDPGSHPALFMAFESSLAHAHARRLRLCHTRPGDDRIEVTGLDATPGDPESVARGLSSLLARGLNVVVAMDGEAAASRVGPCSW